MKLFVGAAAFALTVCSAPAGSAPKSVHSLPKGDGSSAADNATYCTQIQDAETTAQKAYDALSPAQKMEQAQTYSAMATGWQYAVATHGCSHGLHPTGLNHTPDCQPPGPCLNPLPTSSGHRVDLGGKVVLGPELFDVVSPARTAISSPPFTVAEIQKVAPKARLDSRHEGGKTVYFVKLKSGKTARIEDYVAQLNQYESFVNRYGYTLRDGALRAAPNRGLNPAKPPAPVSSTLGLKFALRDRDPGASARSRAGSRTRLNGARSALPRERIVHSAGAYHFPLPAQSSLPDPSAPLLNFRYPKDFPATIESLPKPIDAARYGFAPRALQLQHGIAVYPTDGAHRVRQGGRGQAQTLDCKSSSSSSCAITMGDDIHKDVRLSSLGQWLAHGEPRLCDYPGAISDWHLYRQLNPGHYLAAGTPDGIACDEAESPNEFGALSPKSDPATLESEYVFDLTPDDDHSAVKATDLDWSPAQRQYFLDHYNNPCDIKSHLGADLFALLYWSPGATTGSSHGGSDSQLTGDAAKTFFDGTLAFNIARNDCALGDGGLNNWFGGNVCLAYASVNRADPIHGIDISESAGVSAYATVFGLTFTLLEGTDTTEWIQKVATHPTQAVGQNDVSDPNDTTSLSPSNNSESFKGPEAVIPLGPIPLTITSSLTASLDVGDPDPTFVPPPLQGSPSTATGVVGMAVSAGAAVAVDFAAEIDALVVSAGVEGTLSLFDDKLSGGIKSILDTAKNQVLVDKSYQWTLDELAGTLSAFVEVDLLIYDKRWDIQLAHFDGLHQTLPLTEEKDGPASAVSGFGFQCN